MIFEDASSIRSSKQIRSISKHMNNIPSIATKQKHVMRKRIQLAVKHDLFGLEIWIWNIDSQLSIFQI